MNFFIRALAIVIYFSISSVLFYSCDQSKKSPNYKIVLEADIKDALIQLAGENSDKDYFIKALKKSDEALYADKSNNNSYLKIFIPALLSESSKSLTAIFYTLKKDSASNEEVVNEINRFIKEGIERQMKVLAKRLEKRGALVFSTKRRRPYRIEMEVYAENPESLSEWITAKGDLYFTEVLSSKESKNILSMIDLKIKINDSLRAKFIDVKKAEAVNKLFVETEKDSTEKEEPKPLPSSGLINFLQGGSGEYSSLMYGVKDTNLISRIISEPAIQQIIPEQISIYWLGIRGDKFVELLMIYNANSARYHWMKGDEISQASLTLENDQPAISFEMERAGAIQWKKLTSRLASLNPHGRIAIILDDKCLMAPTVSNEIPNGKAIVTGNFGIEEAQEISSLIVSGVIPFKCKIVEIKSL